MYFIEFSLSWVSGLTRKILIKYSVIYKATLKFAVKSDFFVSYLLNVRTGDMTVGAGRVDVVLGRQCRSSRNNTKSIQYTVSQSVS